MTQRVLATTVSTAVFLCTFFVPIFPQENAQSSAQPSAMKTNALGGVFSSDRRFWFAVPDGQRLRLSVNGNETYRGLGPASSTLSARAGEDRSYEVVAERRSAPPEDLLLESRAFVVRIDASAPAPVKVSGSSSGASGTSWSLDFEAEPDARVFAVVDADSYLSSYTDLSSSLSFKARRVEGLAWCVDSAGNASVPARFSFKPFSLVVANPVPGEWANKQRLVIRTEGASEVFWSDSGEDPFGSSGKRYDSPVVVEKTGSVVLQIAARSPDGRVERRQVSYSVVGQDDAALKAYRELEGAPLLSEKELLVPAGRRWDIGAEGASAVASAAEFAFPGDRSVTLRPVAGVLRFVPLFVRDASGVHRYLFSLGSERKEAEASASAPGSAASLSGDAVPSAPLLYSAGRARLAAWERRQGSVRYRWAGSALWEDALQPIPVPSEGGSLEWLVDKGSAVEGPFSKTFESAAVEAAFPSAVPRSSLAASSVSPGPVDLSAPSDRKGVRFSLSTSADGGTLRTFELSPDAPMRLDVCDGEQLSWTASGDGESVSIRIDRRPPSQPLLNAPEEGSWARDVPIVSFASDEGRVEASAHWKDEDGRTGVYPLPVSARLRSFKKGPVEYLIEARVVDDAGNPGTLVSRRFTVDESTVYASDLTGGRGDARNGVDPRPGDGSRASPFSSLNEALALARAQGRSRVWISGRVTMRGRSELFDGVSVEGGYGADWKKGGEKAEVVFATDASLFTRSGSARLSGLRLLESGSRGASPLSLSGSTLEMEGVVVVPAAVEKIAVPFLSAQAKAVVKAKDCRFSGGSPAVDVKESNLHMVECLLIGTPSREFRSVALRAADSSVRLESTRIESGRSDSPRRTSISVGLDLRGGSLSLTRTVVQSAADESSSGIVARNVSGTAIDADVVSSGLRYASAVSLEGGSASFSKGSLSASARDAVALINNDVRESRFEGVRFSIEGSGVVRAVQVRGLFPSLSGCRFSATGSSQGSEALAGDAPSSGSVRGNLFHGFSYLYDRIFDTEALASFNRRFSGTGPANDIAETDGM